MMGMDEHSVGVAAGKTVFNNLTECLQYSFCLASVCPGV